MNSKTPNIPFVKRKPLPGEALPPYISVMHRAEYKVGQGDVPQFRRPNSDHSHLKSHGNLT